MNKPNIFSSSDIEFTENKVMFERLHSGGNDGQNTNKVKTGVRTIYESTCNSTVCTDE